MTKRRRCNWLDDLPIGLPEGFDYGNIRTVYDAESLMFRLPNEDRGKAARGLYEHRDQIGHQVVYAGMMEAWGYDHAVTRQAFQTDDDFAAALRAVAPPVKLTEPVRAFRGIIVTEGDPAAPAIGLSWSRSPDIACWFALRVYLFAGVDLGAYRPFVFFTVLQPHMIVTAYHGRGERELIVEPWMLAEDLEAIRVNGTGFTLFDLDEDSRAPETVIAKWLRAADRHQRAKQEQERRSRDRYIARRGAVSSNGLCLPGQNLGQNKPRGDT
jgi:hypothetical protein